jgi:U2-associated protein SR140
LKENGTGTEMRDAGGFLSEGLDGATGQDAALAMGEGAAARELASLPLAELERRCKHNGLSIRGGTEVMVARLLSLEEAEKQKNQEQEEEIRAAQGYLKSSAAAAKEGSDTGVRVRGEETRGAWTQIESGWREPKSGYPEAEDARLKDDSRHTGATPSGLSGVVSSTLPIPMLGLKVFGEKSEKAEPVLPASKWTREDGSSDNENEDDKGLGLGYSSDDSEDLTKMDTKGDKPEYTVADSSMDEERRYATNFKLFPVLESHVHLKIYVCQGFHRVVCMCRLLYLSCTTKPFFEPSIILSRATHLPDHL